MRYKCVTNMLLIEPISPVIRRLMSNNKKPPGCRKISAWAAFHFFLVMLRNILHAEVRNPAKSTKNGRFCYKRVTNTDSFREPNTAYYNTITVQYL